ncbi:MAG: DUF3383 family protein [Clostridia bacterium]|nr:DUF3383 family protein [Clostridia bacterium]
MANYQIPLTYVVNVSTVSAGQGLEPLQLGTILLLTDDEPVNALSGDYILSRTASTIMNAFGTESTTAKMANAIFSQTPNILNAGGYVVVAPYKEDVIQTPATSGTLTTVDLSEKLTALLAVTAGDLTVTVDGGTPQALTNINLTQAQDLNGIAAVLDEAIEGATVTAVNDALVFTSETTGTTSSVAISETVSSVSDLYGSDYLNGASAIAAPGQAAVLGPETTAQAIARLSQQIYTEGILTTRTISDLEAIDASNLVEGMPNNILFLTDISTSTLVSGGLFNTIQNNKNTRKLLYLTGGSSDDIRANAKLFAAAFASRGLSVNYGGSNSTITMTYKDLAGVPVDTNISETILAQCEAIGADVYCSIEGLAKVISFKQGGLYFDQLANQIWLRTTVQTTVANLLFTTRTKIPQTTQGVNTIVNAINAVLNQGVINGMIAAGEWNSPDTFGVYADFMRNIRTQGYYVYFTPLAEQSQADREARKCPVISIAVKEAGAIESANIIIYLEA